MNRMVVALIALLLAGTFTHSTLSAQEVSVRRGTVTVITAESAAKKKGILSETTKRSLGMIAGSRLGGKVGGEAGYAGGAAVGSDVGAAVGDAAGA